MSNQLGPVLAPEFVPGYLEGIVFPLQIGLESKKVGGFDSFLIFIDFLRSFIVSFFLFVSPFAG